MFTQCPDCKTVFEIAPADLAVAAGLVRCGECGQTFSALRSLAETPLEFENPDLRRPATATDSSPVATASDTESASDDQNTSSAGASAEVIAAATALAAKRAHTRQSDDAEASPDGGDTEPEQLATESDSRDEADTGDAPPVAGDDEAAIDEADAIAEDEQDELDAQHDGREETDIDEASAIAGDGAGDAEVTLAALDDSGDEIDDIADDDDGGDEIVLDEFYEPPDTDEEEPIDDGDDWDWEEPAGDSEAREIAETEPVDESALFSLPLPELHATGIVATAAVPEKLEGGEAAIDPFAQDVHEYDRLDAAGADQAMLTHPPEPQVRRNDAVDAEDARDLRDYLRAPRPGRVAAAAWTGGSILLGLLLVLQAIHHHRGDLVLHQRFGPAIKSLYRLVGLDVRPNWRVDDYKIVGQARLIELPPEQTGQPPGEFRFVAIIANRADRPQPPPMVRITLRDRWGDPQGVRNFAPPEYLTDRSMVEQLLEPGQRLRVVLNLLGPSAEIDGFDFDMCLPDTRGKLRCSSEPAS